MIDLDALERQLGDESLRIVGPEPIVDDAAIFAAVAADRSHGWSMGSLFSAANLVLAGAIVALFGGVVLSGVLSGDVGEPLAPGAATAGATAAAEQTIEVNAADAPSAAVTPATIVFPDELPPGSSRGTFDTDAGPVQWIRLNGRELSDDGGTGTLPAIGQLIPWDDGIAAWFSTAAGRPPGHPGFGALASTTDGVAWQLEDIPGVGYGSIGVVDGTVYLVRPELRQVWAREVDHGEWRELDASVLAAAMPGPGWKTLSFPRLAGPYQAGEVAYFEIAERYVLPRGQLGIPFAPATRLLRRIDDRHFALCRVRTCLEDAAQQAYRLRFDPVSTGLRVTDERTGSVLGVIEGATVADLYDGERKTRTFGFAIDGSSVIAVGQSVGRPSPGRLGGLEGEAAAPPPQPEGTEMLDRHGRIVQEATERTFKSRWLRAGDEWVRLDDVVPRGSKAEMVASHGQLVVLASDPMTDEREMWLLALPDGA
jgi:hypothetical protein